MALTATPSPNLGPFLADKNMHTDCGEHQRRENGLYCYESVTE